MLRLPSKPDYSPREFGERLNPPRSGQWVLVRVQGKVQGEEIRALRKGLCWHIPHEELRRLTGDDLTLPGHEVVSSERDDKLRELRLCMADVDMKMARMRQLVAELEP